MHRRVSPVVDASQPGPAYHGHHTASRTAALPVLD